MRLRNTCATLAILLATPATAQESFPSTALADAMQTLPDHTRYRVELVPGDMPASRQETLATMIGDSVRGQHFYGAVYAYRPAAGGKTEFTIRSGLHSRESARRGALADCEVARSIEDGACALVGEIVPEGWSEATPELSHIAVQAIRATAGQLLGNVVVARSRNGDAFEIRSGEDVRDATVDACNERNAEAGLPEDCEIVISDRTSG